MNVNALKVITPKRKDIKVPIITSTEPVQGKEIDLTFVRFAQRKKNATEYIASVDRRLREKEFRKEYIKSIVLDVLCGISLVAGFCGIILIGVLF